MPRVLMVAFQFPPLAGSSGIQRTLRFVQHLPEFGWEPVVLSAHPRAYERTSPDLLAEIPPETVVRRAPAWDSARHFSIRGRYPGLLARPDRWMSWLFGAVGEGMDLIRRHRPDVLWSTYPIATAHAIAARLHKKSGVPWVADFRDPMAQDGYPPDARTWRHYKRIEEEAFGRARYCVFTTPSAARFYRQRYPDAAERVAVVENGYDEKSFSALAPGTEPLVPGALTLLHSGIVYPQARDPSALFAAVGRLLERGITSPARLRLRFRAPVHGDFLAILAARHGITDCVEILPAIPYREALAEMLRADALVVLQASDCNQQIPAKFYEYLRAGRPILGLTDPAGDTAGVLRQAGLETIARLDSAEEITALLTRFLGELASGQARGPRPEAVENASRRGRTAGFVHLLEACLGEESPFPARPAPVRR